MVACVRNWLRYIAAWYAYIFVTRIDQMMGCLSLKQGADTSNPGKIFFWHNPYEIEEYIEEPHFRAAYRTESRQTNIWSECTAFSEGCWVYTISRPPFVKRKGPDTNDMYAIVSNNEVGVTCENCMIDVEARRFCFLNLTIKYSWCHLITHPRNGNISGTAHRFLFAL